MRKFNKNDEIDQFHLEEQQYVDSQLAEQDEYFAGLKLEREEEYLYEVDCLRLNHLKQKLRGPLADSFLNLTKRRIIKFEGVIQAAFYLLSYDKAEVNIEGTNNLNWKVVKQMIHRDWLDFLLDYDHRGSKKDKPYPWALIERVQRRLDRFQ